MERVRLTQKLAATQPEKKRPSVSKGVLERNTAGFEYDPGKAKVLRKALHNLNVALGSMLASVRDLSLLRGSEITPDGLLGGRGFIMNFKDIKAQINEAVTNIADITDTIADELTNPKWKLNKSDIGRVEREQDSIENKVEEIEETVENVPKPGEEPKPEPEADVSPEEPAVSEELSPEDVRDSSEIESLKRYQEHLAGRSIDKTANILSKQIMANLLKGKE